jgi:putative potassium uptake protein
MGTDAEVLELVAQPRAAVTRGRLKDLNFPRGAIVGGIVHDGKSLIATGETVVEAGDRAVVFAQSSALERVTRYFSER